MVEQVIFKYIGHNQKLYNLYMIHVQMVCKKALAIAARVPELKPDILFIKEASMLHDIGIVKVNSPEIFCNGDFPYIAHGYLGREILEAEGFAKHGLVAERHTGAGISLTQILDNDLPLPHRDMVPISVEEKIICYADNFYSKDVDKLEEEKTLGAVRKSLERFGEEVSKRFEEMVLLFKD